MKLNIAVLFYMATSTATNAFAPRIISRQSSSLSLVSLLMQDTSKAVEEAMAASEKYGKQVLKLVQHGLLWKNWMQLIGESGYQYLYFNKN
jgi:hypothetical protein